MTKYTQSDHYYKKVFPRLDEIKKWSKKNSSLQFMSDQLGISSTTFNSYRSIYHELSKIVPSGYDGRRNTSGGCDKFYTRRIKPYLEVIELCIEHNFKVTAIAEYLSIGKSTLNKYRSNISTLNKLFPFKYKGTRNDLKNIAGLKSKSSITNIMENKNGNNKTLLKNLVKLVSSYKGLKKDYEVVKLKVEDQKSLIDNLHKEVESKHLAIVELNSRIKELTDEQSELDKMAAQITADIQTLNIDNDD